MSEHDLIATYAQGDPHLEAFLTRFYDDVVRDLALGADSVIHDDLSEEREALLAYVAKAGVSWAREFTRSLEKGMRAARASKAESRLDEAIQRYVDCIDPGRQRQHARRRKAEKLAKSGERLLSERLRDPANED
jgi:hypothetical protein